MLGRVRGDGWLGERGGGELFAQERDHERCPALWVFVQDPVPVAFEQLDASGWKRVMLTLGLFAREVGVLGSP